MGPSVRKSNKRFIHSFIHFFVRLGSTTPRRSSEWAPLTWSEPTLSLVSMFHDIHAVRSQLGYTSSALRIGDKPSRIRLFPHPGSLIQDWQDPGSSLNNLSIFNPKTCNNFSKIRSGMFSPVPDFFHHESGSATWSGFIESVCWPWIEEKIC